MTKKNQKRTRVLDPQAGQEAIQRLEAALRAMPAAEVAAPNSDPQDGAVAALALVDLARKPPCKVLLDLLPREVFDPDTVEELEAAAWATWYAHVKMQTEAAGASGMRVDAETYDAAGRHLGKLLKLIEYHVGERPGVAVEIADIRRGTGYQDRASDLVRTATLWEQFRDELAGDQRNFHPEDAAVARQYAEAIVGGVRASLGKSAQDWADLRNRAWSRMSFYYDEVRAAGDFIFRRKPEQRAQFVALRQAVAPNKSQRRAASEGSDAAVGRGEGLLGSDES